MLSEWYASAVNIATLGSAQVTSRLSDVSQPNCNFQMPSISGLGPSKLPQNLPPPRKPPPQRKKSPPAPRQAVPDSDWYRPISPSCMAFYMNSMRNKLKRPIKRAVVNTPDPSSLYSASSSRPPSPSVRQPSLSPTVAYVTEDDKPPAPDGSASLSERKDNCHELDVEVLQAVSFLSEITTPSDIPQGLSTPTREQHEVNFNHAVKHPELFPPHLLQASTDKELHKMFQKMEVMELITDYDKQVDKDAIFIASMMLSKIKYHANGKMDCVSSRLALNGAMQKEGTFGETFAPTADESSMLCCMSAFQAHAIQHGYINELEYETFDVCGAFLHCPLVSARMIITKIPSNINHPYAGRMAIVRKSCYGLRQSNKTFADSFNKRILAAGFIATLDPCIYMKIVRGPNGIDRRCYVSTHVDDGKAMFNYRPFYDQLIAILEQAYGELKKSKLTGFTGTSFELHKNGAFTRTQSGYILRFLENINVSGITIAKVPSTFDLFEDTSKSPSCDIKLYRTIIGSLIHVLRTRYDIQKEVVHLSSKMSSATMADLSKAVLVLRYLSGTPNLGPTYFTKQGPTLSCFVDCSYGVHVDGRSHAGFSLHIGADNAPFFVSSKKQNDCVAVGSMEGEYVALSAAARKVLEFRYFLENIGFPQPLPTVVYEDNMSAINLAIAPAITRKSRHIHIRHHFIRDCVAKHLITLEHMPTDQMLADFLTKPFGPKKFNIFRDRYFNVNSIPH
jgi:hypothetical protein